MPRLRLRAALCALAFVALAQPATAGQFTVIHRFGRADQQWIFPVALALGPNGAAFGTTNNGGRFGGGSIYRIEPDGTFTTLYAFPVYAYPDNLLVRGNTIYAVCPQGGPGNFGQVVSLGIDGGHLKLLHSFSDDGQGADPVYYNNLAIDSRGVIYGSAPMYREKSTGYVLYRIARDGAYTVLQTFTLADGPPEIILRDDQHLLLTFSDESGVALTQYVNKIEMYTVLTNKLKTIYDFGSAPQFIVTAGMDAAGAIYGYTIENATSNQIFKLSPASGTYSLSFLAGVAQPTHISGVTLLAPDTLIGTTGDTADGGSLFRFAGGKLTTLHTDKNDQQAPVFGSPLQQPDGAIIGVAARRGPTGNGEIYTFTPTH